jgi:hypothetical protein
MAMSVSFVKRWGSRLGDKAARSMFRSLLSVMAASIVGMAFVAISLTAPKVYPLEVGTALTLGGVALTSWFVNLVLASRALTSLYGTKISVLSLPPLRDDRCDAWCQRHEVTIPK